MDQRIKKLWIEALRSGEFKQGQGYLERDGRYCALGVLSVLAMLEGVCTYNYKDGLGLFDNRQFKLSYNVMKWADIAQDDEHFLNPIEHSVLINIKGSLTTVMDLNDQGKSFKQIANLIERYM
jgi:hypothetical protein